MNIAPRHITSISLSLFRRMSYFSPLQLTSPCSVDDFLSSVYTAEPRNVFSVAVTGGGSAVVSDLFTVPGASNSLMHASVPYSRAALSQLLGGPDQPQSCSTSTATLMAKAVFRQTVTQLLADSDGQFDVLSEANIFGVSCTAALASSRPKKGLHRCHVASFSNQCRVRTWDVYFRKGLRTRREEDIACSRVILDAIAASSGLPTLSGAYLSPHPDGEEDEFNPDVQVERVVPQERSSLESAFDDLFSARTDSLLFVRKPASASTSSDSSPVEQSRHGGVCAQFSLLENAPLPANCFVYPGSYNPLHEGHIALAAAAIQLKAPATTNSGGEVAAPPLVFEISALNADKPPLTKDEVLRRVSQFAKGSPMDAALQAAGITNVAVCITSRPFFAEKAALFPGCRFVVGADTLARLVLPKYYNNSRDEMIASLALITSAAGHGCSFIVGGRKDPVEPSGFCDLASVLRREQLPDVVRDKLDGLSDEQFRFDISSTEIRSRAAAKKLEEAS